VTGLSKGGSRPKAAIGLPLDFQNEQNGWTKVNYQSLRRVAANVAISGV